MTAAVKKVVGIPLALFVVIAGGICVPAFAQGGAAGSASGTTAATDVSEKKVTLNLENADIRYALKLLFTQAGVDYVVDRSMPPPSAT